MNLSTPVLFQYFLELSIWGKVAVIAGYALMALLIVLWEQSRAHRHAVTKLPAVIEPTEKFIHTSSTRTRKQNQYDPLKGERHLLDILRSSLGKGQVYRKSYDGRENHLKYLHQYIRESPHIRTIVNKLRRLVNHSGTEPSQFGKLRGKYHERAHFLPMTDWKMVN